MIMMVQAGITEFGTVTKYIWYKVLGKDDARNGFVIADDEREPFLIDHADILNSSPLDGADYLPIRNEPHGITGVKHSVEDTPKKPISVLLDIDIFRKASELVMETSSHASSIHTLDSLEKEMKRQTASLCESLQDILTNDPDYYGHCSIGTLNYSVSFKWVDEDVVELDISIHPEMQDGMIVETDIESIMGQL